MTAGQESAITKLVPQTGRRIADPYAAAEAFDTEYKDFVRRCVWLRNHIDKTHSIKLTPQEIDKLLLKIANDEAKGSNEAI